MSEDLTHGASEFRATDNADVAVHVHAGEARDDVVRRTVEVGAPVDPDLGIAGFPGFKVVLGAAGFRPRFDDGSAFLTGLETIPMFERHSTTVAPPQRDGTDLPIGLVEL